MKTFPGLCISLLLPIFVQAENWPGWRGPRGDGTSGETNLPLRWDASTNLAWKTPLPGLGHASPIVFRSQVFVAACIPETEERILLSYDRVSGRELWRQTVLRSALEKKHSLNSHASSTPATDGDRVYVTFLDKNEMAVAAYDLSGHQLWLVHPGPFSSVHGFCSSPVLYREEVILNGDHDGDSYLVALEKKTGKTVWKVPRQNHTRSYSVPLIREMRGRMQMALSGDKSVASYDPDSGKQLWMIDGPTDQFVASPVYSEKTGWLYITGGFPDHHILAIDPSGTGNISSHIRWRTNKGVAYVPSPIIADDYFLVVSDSGIAHCFDAATGKIYWQERMGEHHASLVSSAGNVYFLNDAGTMRVIKPGKIFVQLAQNEFGEKCFASPAVSGGHIFVRTEHSLISVGSPQPEKKYSGLPRISD